MCCICDAIRSCIVCIIVILVVIVGGACLVYFLWLKPLWEEHSGSLTSSYSSVGNLTASGSTFLDKLTS